MSSIFARQAHLAVFFLLLSVGTALAQPGFVYSSSVKRFTFLDPNHLALGVNNLGQIVGVKPDGPFPIHGFLQDPTHETLVDFPGAYYTSLNAINDVGQIVGSQCGGPAPLACTGFLKDGNAFTPFGFPGAIFTYASGINNLAQIVGAYRVEVVTPNGVQDFDHALLIDGNGLSGFDFPGARDTLFTGINDQAVIVGIYTELIASWPGLRYRGFTKTGSALALIDYPDALFTFATGINNLGQVVGSYQDQYGYYHGFVKSRGKYKSFDVFGADTHPESINDYGEIAGNYYPRPVVSTIDNVITDIRALNLATGVKKSLVAKLKDVIYAFEIGDAERACTGGVNPIRS
jgi:probable HAF family extracellular repeat protein